MDITSMDKDNLLEQYIKNGVHCLNQGNYVEAFDNFNRAQEIAPLRDDLRRLLHKALEGKIAQEASDNEFEIEIKDGENSSVVSAPIFKYTALVVIIIILLSGIAYTGNYFYKRFFSTVTVSDDTSDTPANENSQADELYSEAIDMTRKKNYTKAIELLEKALEIDAGNMKYQRKIASTAAEVGFQLYNKQDFLGSIEMFRKATTYDANNPEYFRNLGWAYLELGKRYKNRGESYQLYFKEAENAQRKAISIDPNFAGAHYGLAFVNIRQNNIKEAIKSFKKTIDVDPSSEWADKARRALKNQGVKVN